MENKQIRQLKKELDKVNQLLLEVLDQACGDDYVIGRIDNRCMSSYEEACSYLETKGLLSKINDRCYYLIVQEGSETKK